MFETVLFPLDQSREVVEAATKALNLARSHNSKLILLSVVQPKQPEMDDHAVVATLLAETQARFEQVGVSCDVVEREGMPAFVICDVADELNVDVIVMGTRGVNLEAESGGTAARVIQLAPCPVLVVP
ncbi:MAG: universal stress protein [Synechococcus sp. SP2 MAG]|jgi:nucleotide-binding universal stress UspA family protein|nr:universal stress protein [Synechococcus sp. SP2 MAG]